jgi:hypothetical protein
VQKHTAIAATRGSSSAPLLKCETDLAVSIVSDCLKLRIPEIASVYRRNCLCGVSAAIHSGMPKGGQPRRTPS